MTPRLELDELIEHFTLLPDEVTLLGDRSGASRLGFALLLKFFTRAGRFPSGRSELADEAVEFVASQVGIPASELRFYDWSGRTIKRHRVEVRRALGFRECSVKDAEKVTVWLTEQVATSERRPELVRHALLGRCREERIEPPSPQVVPHRPARRARLRAMVYVVDGAVARVRAVDPDLARWDADDRGYADVPVGPPLTDLQIARQLPALRLALGDPRPHVRGKIREYVTL